MGHVYVTDPIDFWNGWQTPENVVKKRGDGLNEYGEGSFVDYEEYEICFAELRKKASILGWEGDIVEGPFISVFPQTPMKYWHPKIMIAFKQSNNGTCFIYSGWPLYQYEEDEYCEKWPGHDND